MTQTCNMWRFPSSGYGEIKGINDAGVETFSSNSLRSLIRESLQNSLDASLGGMVFVEFEEFEMPFSSVPDSRGIWHEIERCMESGGDGSEAAIQFLKGARNVMKAPSIRVMRISDYGTTGLRGADKCAPGSDWSRLIKESGSSSKVGTSGGSFGIGKYASFACSDLRTVFFSSLDDKGVESHIGVARLISSEVEDGQHTSGIGYYSGTERNLAIPGQLTLNGLERRGPGESGTDIFIIGFKCEGDIKSEIVKYVLMDFLVSVWKGKLAVSINGMEVNKHTLGAHIGGLNEYDENPLVKETIEHYDLLIARDGSTRKIVFDPKDLRGVRKYKDFKWNKGECTLYIKQGDDKLNREVTVTRAAGMRLFNQNHISGSIRFTGILMIEGEKMNRDFKEMEAPSHDEWSAERAADCKLAGRMIKALRNWVKDTVTETFKIEIEDEVEAFGTALYLPKREIGESDGDGQVEETLTSQISEVHQKDITPKKSENRLIAIKQNVDFDSEGDAILKGKGNKKSRGKKPRRGSGPGDNEGFTHVAIRQRLVCIDRAAGRYRLAFTVPHDTSRARIYLSIQGEQGEDYVSVKSAQATTDGPRHTTFERNTITVEELTAGTRASVTFTTDFPHYCMMGADYYEAK